MKPQVALAALGAVFLVAGIARFYYLHAFSSADAIHAAIAVPIAFITLFVSDYVRQHGGLAFVLVALIVVLVAALSPAFAVGLGVALLGSSAVAARADHIARRLRTNTVPEDTTPPPLGI